MTNEFEKLIDDLAAYLALATSRKGGGQVGMSYFSGIEVFVPGMADIVNRKYAGQAVIPADAGLPDVPIFDVSSMIQATDSPNCLFALERFRRVKAKDVRGRINSLMPYMIEGGHAFLFRDGKLLTGDLTWFGSPDGRSRWRCIGPSNINVYKQDMDKQTLTNLTLAIGIQFLRDYDWSVHLGYAGYPSLNFPTDPSGVLEVFRLRDIPEGKERRAALLHWVRGHWRKNRNDEAAIIRVREHLRGTKTFDWNGLRCTIKPSAYDLRRLQNK